MKDQIIKSYQIERDELSKPFNRQNLRSSDYLSKEQEQRIQNLKQWSNQTEQQDKRIQQLLQFTEDENEPEREQIENNYEPVTSVLNDGLDHSGIDVNNIQLNDTIAKYIFNGSLAQLILQLQIPMLVQM